MACLFLIFNPFMPEVILLTTGANNNVVLNFNGLNLPAPFEIDTSLRCLDIQKAEFTLKKLTEIFLSVQCPLNPLFFRTSLPVVRPLFDLLQIPNARNTILYCGYNRGWMLIYRTGIDVPSQDYTHFPVESDFKIVCAKYGTPEHLTLIQTFFRKKARNRTSALYDIRPNEVRRVFDLFLDEACLPTADLELKLNRNRVRAHLPLRKLPTKPAPAKDKITFFFKMKKNGINGK